MFDSLIPLVVTIVVYTALDIVSVRIISNRAMFSLHAKSYAFELTALALAPFLMLAWSLHFVWVQTCAECKDVPSNAASYLFAGAKKKIRRLSEDSDYTLPDSEQRKALATRPHTPVVPR